MDDVVVGAKRESFIICVWRPDVLDFDPGDAVLPFGVDGGDVFALLDGANSADDVVVQVDEAFDNVCCYEAVCACEEDSACWCH